MNLTISTLVGNEPNRYEMEPVDDCGLYLKAARFFPLWSSTTFNIVDPIRSKLLHETSKQGR